MLCCIVSMRVYFYIKLDIIKFDVNKYGFFDVNYNRDNCVLTIRRSIVSRRHYCSCGDVIK